MTPQEKQQLQELLEFKRKLEASHSIPLNVDQAFRKRFFEFSDITTQTAKASGSENLGVNEGGAASYSVLGPPDEFLKWVDPTGSIHYIAAWTA